ncbi:hypothetical protein Micbo1qcDRAFT_142448 [Microdochium bolleyi]|uniref:Transcription initiation factor IIB n=1 Tax=Microdochium bolleyi TaxID=196109 RepID=A0A136JHR0_9PEZI|nr:hypothetical protein Micbo1qcDRAFT_142448 [Microdochium bolleyi]
MAFSVQNFKHLELNVPELTQTFNTSLRVSNVCPNCKIDPPNLAEEESAGDLVCTDCGLVLQNHLIDERAEWRAFSNDDSNTGDPSRVGNAGDSLLGPELHTTIATGGGSLGLGLGRAQARSVYDRKMPFLREALAEADECCNLLNLDTQHANCIKDFYKHAMDMKWVPRHDRRTGIAACIAVICDRVFAKSRSLDEVRSCLCSDKRAFGQCYRVVCRGYREEEASRAITNPRNSSTEKGDSSSITQATLGVCERICDRLEFARPFEMSKAASSIIKNAMDMLGGKPPKTIAAACILMACQILQDKRTISQISEAAGCGRPPVQKAYRMIWLARSEVVGADVLAGGQERKLECAREQPC